MVPDAVHRVAVAPAPILALLRAAVGSPLLGPVPDEDTATMGRPLPNAVVIDAGAWVAWCLAGLHACERLDLTQAPDDEGTSWLEVFGDEAKRVVTVLAVRRASGNFTRAAAALRTSRRALRDRLKDAGLYPWLRSPEPTPRQRLDALAFPRLAAAVLGVRSLAVIGCERDTLAAANGPGNMPDAANGPGALAVVGVLAEILERAEVLRMEGLDPVAAIVKALSKHRGDDELACVAVAAWSLAVGTHGARDTTRPTPPPKPGLRELVARAIARARRARAVARVRRRFPRRPSASTSRGSTNSTVFSGSWTRGRGCSHARSRRGLGGTCSAGFGTDGGGRRARARIL
jgi:hypothetical protein